MNDERSTTAAMNDVDVVSRVLAFRRRTTAVVLSRDSTSSLANSCQEPVANPGDLWGWDEHPQRLQSLYTRSPAIAEGPRDAGVPVEIW